MKLKVLYVALLLSYFFLQEVSAQTPSFVTGRVISSDNQGGIAGVSIKVKGTSQGASTDANGAYRIAVPGQNAVLVFSHVSFQQKEVAVNGQSVVNVTLNPSDSKLNEVVVIGYG